MDPELKKEIRLGEPIPNYSEKDGILYLQDKFCLGPESELRTKVLEELHNSRVEGHSGYYCTLKRVRQSFYWKGVNKFMRDFVAECWVCQEVKATALKPMGLLQPLPIPIATWEDVSMDFVTGLPVVKGHTVIVVVVDRLTKYCHLGSLPASYSAITVADFFIKQIVRLHGIPKTIVSDRDKIFLSKFWKEIFSKSGTTLKMSTAYHPESDGQSEIVNKTIEHYLRATIYDNPRSWVELLPWAKLWYNTSHHHSLGMSPFQAVYGRTPPEIIDYRVGDSNVLLRQHDQLLRELRINLHAAQTRMKRYADLKRRPYEFSEGDWVWLRLQPYRQNSVNRWTCLKLAKRYYGPFLIEKKVSSVAYRLKLPAGSNIFPTFHITLLKPFQGKNPESTIKPLPPGYRITPDRLPYKGDSLSSNQAKGKIN